MNNLCPKPQGQPDAGSAARPTGLAGVTLLTQLFLLPVAAAETFGLFEFRSSNNAITITNYPEGATGPVMIPSHIDGTPVKKIGKFAFSKCTEITSIAIPFGVEDLDTRAFAECSSLLSVTIPNSVTRIGWEAFHDCSRLEGVVIPESVEVIGTQAFRACSNLATVTISQGVKRIERQAFESCSSLTSVEIPSSIEDFGVWAFSECSGLESVSLPETLTEIGDSMFQNCSKLNQIILPHGLSRIGREAFSGCINLKINIPTTVKSIGDSAFRGCTSLTGITIPRGIESVGSLAFSDCSNLAYAIVLSHVPKGWLREGGVFFGLDAFRGADDSFTIYYDSRVSEIRSSTWRRYPIRRLSAFPGATLRIERLSLSPSPEIYITGPAAGLYVESSYDLVSWSEFDCFHKGLQPHSLKIELSPRNHYFRIRANVSSTYLAGFVMIPAGRFQLGDVFEEGSDNELPVHDVELSPYWIGRTEVTEFQWSDTYTWALENGYRFNPQRKGIRKDLPVHSVSWYDAVKWCNARSQREGLVPCYYIGESIYTGTGGGSLSQLVCDWAQNGYRLPTEAEWENAARGSLNGKRFPTGDSISHDVANFRNVGGEHYAAGSMGYYADTSTIKPHTSPVASFDANELGLYDVAGNVSEWCWGWSDQQYVTSPSRDPRPEFSSSILSFVVARGGGWNSSAEELRVSKRRSVFHGEWEDIGFRLVRSVTE